jgi:hypothetical protein
VTAAGLLLFSCANLAEAQRDRASPPDSVADSFQRALRTMAWRAAAQRLHPEGLARFRERVDMLVEVNPSALLDDALGGLSAEEYRALSRQEVFVRSMEAMSEQMRGLLHALVVRDVEVIGTVLESQDIAHVVYRSQARLSGAVPETRVMTLKRSPQGWRVLDSPELDVIREALRGFNRGGGRTR